MMKKFLFTSLLVMGLNHTVYSQNEPLHISANGNIGVNIAAPDNKLDVQDAAKRSGQHPSNLPLYVTGNAGVEFRNPDGTRGINFLKNTISASGSLADQDLNLVAKGSNGKIRFLTNSLQRVLIDQNGNVGIGTGDYLQNKLQLGGNLHMVGNSIFFKGNPADGNALVKYIPATDRMAIAGWQGVVLGHVAGNGVVEPVLTATLNNRVGINTEAPRAFLDVAGYADKGKLATVMARLEEGDNTREGTYLGVRGFATQAGQDNYNGKAFSLEYSFWGHVNSAINFYRGWSETGGSIRFSTSNDHERMVITDEGRVGIGTMDPGAMLEVRGTIHQGSRDYTYFNAANQSKRTSGTREVSILSSGDIATGYEFVAYSDSRIKKDFSKSVSASDLLTLNKLQVENYRYIDAVNYGDHYKKGFVAQEVEQVFPEAVKRGRDFVPDIFTEAQTATNKAGTVTITMNKPHHLVSGDVVKLITKEGQEEKPVKVLSENSFCFESPEAYDQQVFVFGKKVNDFRMVDYDRLFTLNVSATQELSKQVDVLKAENDKMRKENEQMKTLFNQLQNRLVALESKGDQPKTVTLAKQ